MNENQLSNKSNDLEEFDKLGKLLLKQETGPIRNILLTTLLKEENKLVVIVNNNEAKNET